MLIYNFKPLIRRVAITIIGASPTYRSKSLSHETSHSPPSHHVTLTWSSHPPLCWRSPTWSWGEAGPPAGLRLGGWSQTSSGCGSSTGPGRCSWPLSRTASCSGRCACGARCCLRATWRWTAASGGHRPFVPGCLRWPGRLGVLCSSAARMGNEIQCNPRIKDHLQERQSF